MFFASDRKSEVCCLAKRRSTVVNYDAPGNPIRVVAARYRHLSNLNVSAPIELEPIHYD